MEPEPQFKVVLNDDQQYSIWPADLKNAAGWKSEGTTGTKQECLSKISKVWTNMRPSSTA